jgi:hypothetical protein
VPKYTILSLIIFIFLFAGFVSAQSPSNTDTLPITTGNNNLAGAFFKKDSVTVSVQKNVVSKKPFVYKQWVIDSTVPFSIQHITWQALSHHPWLGFSAAPVIKTSVKRNSGKEILFYAIIAFLIAFALLRQAFPKYFHDLFRLFFRTTLKQRQIREQLMQTPLPSLLLNGFFAISAGMYINLLLDHYKVKPVDNFWLSFLYCVAAVSSIYFIKFIGLRLSGWLFNMQSAANAYIFVVFVVNKIIGIFLIPFVVMLALAKGVVYEIALMASWCMIAGLIFYRLILTFGAVHNQVRVNPFHFILYICAFEIAPILLLYKGLLVFFQQTT